ELERAIPPGTSREPQLQAKAAAAVAELLRPIPDSILRFNYARIAASRLGLPVEMLARRTGGGGARPEPAAPVSPASPPPAADGGPRLVRSLEEQVIDQLLQREDAAPLPPRDQLPPPEVFLDTECRNIYEAFCALYAEAGSPPDAQAVRSRLGEGEG